MKRGLLIIMSGPSGVGKGKKRKKAMEDKTLNLFYSISMTTRNPRPGEENGREYYFVSKEEFQKNIDNGNLLEWAEFVGNRYGTPKDKVEQMRDEGKNVLLEIDVNGTSQVLSKLDKNDVVSVFIAPPSLEELEARIRGRSTETDDVIKNRLAQASRELSQKDQYRFVVVNDKLEDAVEEFKKIILNN